MKIYTSLMLFMLFTSSVHSVHGQTISIMSFNIRYDNPGDNENAWSSRKDEMVKMIGNVHPDFLGIQEGLNHQVEYLHEHLPGYKYIGVGRDDGSAKGEYCALYYDSAKFEMNFHKTFWLSPTPESVSVGWDAALERICTYGMFVDRHSKDTLHVFNTHFDHMGAEARNMSAHLLIRKMAEQDLKNSHIILMGDLNSIPTSEPVSIIRQELDYGLEISQSEFDGPEGTFNAFDLNSELTKCIDYVFTNKFEVLEYRHIDDRRMGGLYLSDHFPVLAKVRISKYR